MLVSSPSDSPQSSFFDITQQLNLAHPLIALSQAIPWSELEEEFAIHYSEKGRVAKPIRLMCGLLMLKQLFNLSDENVIVQWQMNPYYQVFCGETSFQLKSPCHSTELVKFRQRLGVSGIEKLFALSVALHGKSAQESIVLVDTTVQEKAITYPTDSKLAIKIINRLNKLAKAEGVSQRRTYVKEVKALRLACRHFRHVKRRAKAKKALKRLRTIAGTLIRELNRKLSPEAIAREADRFALYEKVLSQQPQDKDKIYSLHEPQVVCVGKGKDHKAYEYGSKASIVSTLNSKIIVGVESHEAHLHDSKTLSSVVAMTQRMTKTPIELAITDRGYRGAQKHVGFDVLIPGQACSKDSARERCTKRKLCRARSAIEPIIGHLKQDYRLQRNWLKGAQGDAINLLLAACAWNLRKWILAFFLFEFNNQICALFVLLQYNSRKQPTAILMIISKKR